MFVNKVFNVHAFNLLRMNHFVKFFYKQNKAAPMYSKTSVSILKNSGLPSVLLKVIYILHYQ